MQAFIDEPDYTILESSDTYTTTSAYIYPYFKIMLDLDHNGIGDDWEIQLVEKFKPGFILNHLTEWVAPEPVEYIGVVKDSLWIQVYNMLGQEVSDHPISEQNAFDPPVSVFHAWVNSSNPNWSHVTDTGYPYTGRPPGSAYGSYRLRFHYNYAGDINNPGGWINYYQDERQNNNFPHTVYAHFFWHSGKPVIQYWMYYPYNDGYNNHEADWEHINVRISDQNPDLATIEMVDFYFHNKVKTMASGFQLIDGTHPVVYVGGTCLAVWPPASCELGEHTGGSYPAAGEWYGVGEWGYNEYVRADGPVISYQNVLVTILPEKDDIDYDVHPELSWFKSTVRFGYYRSDSPWSFLEELPFTSSGSVAGPGPAHHDAWNKVGSEPDGYDNYNQ